MAKVLGINSVFHDPSAGLVVDGQVVTAAEEERFSRRKHGKMPVPFATSELPEGAVRLCLGRGGLEPADLDAVAYSCFGSSPIDALAIGPFMVRRERRFARTGEAPAA